MAFASVDALIALQALEVVSRFISPHMPLRLSAAICPIHSSGLLQARGQKTVAVATNRMCRFREGLFPEFFERPKQLAPLRR